MKTTLPAVNLREYAIKGLEATIAEQQALLAQLRNGNGPGRPKVSKVARTMERTWDQKQNGHGILKLKGLNIRDACLKIIAREPTRKVDVVRILKAQKVTKNVASMGSAMSALSQDKLITRTGDEKRGGPWKLTDQGETAAAAIGTR